MLVETLSPLVEVPPAPDALGDSRGHDPSPQETARCADAWEVPNFTSH
jgi:hypothetical protein